MVFYAPVKIFFTYVDTDSSRIVEGIGISRENHSPAASEMMNFLIQGSVRAGFKSRRVSITVIHKRGLEFRQLGHQDLFLCEELQRIFQRTPLL